MKDFFVNLYMLYTDMAFYMTIGLIMVFIIKIFINPEVISKYLGGNLYKSVLLASAIGVPLPLCSCSVLPTAIEIRKSGAGFGATASYLISTPMVGVDSLIATYGMMGPFMALFRAVSAFISGIVSGIVGGKLIKTHNEPEDIGHCSRCDHEHTPHNGKLVSGLKYAFGEFIDDLALPFTGGVIVAALIITLIPDNYFLNTALGNNFIAMIVMLAIGLPMYICSTSSIPVAVALIMKGLSPGAAFVFLFAGPIMNIASIMLMTKFFGRKATAVLISSAIVCALISGAALDFIVNRFNVSILLNAGVERSELPVYMLIVAGIFSVLLLISLIRKFKARILLGKSHKCHSDDCN
ncbi:MAG: permease [Christensenellales bacterium]|jgi:uncharacterized membrane protein YraQ (UPF0718 family)